MPESLKDLTGFRFGKLTAIEETEKRQKGNIIWRCRCDCGKEVLVPGSRLTGWYRTSCGCSPKIYDLIGQTFGSLTVIGDSGQRKGEAILWRCRCVCGNEILTTRFRLNKGRATSCGCAPKRNDLSGKVFGKLTVLEDSGQRQRTNGNIIWRCRCECGNEVLVPGINLTSGTAISCGCIPKANDLRGQVFGNLTVVEDSGQRQHKGIVWRCRCVRE